MDVHTATISVAVRDAAGKLIMESVIETKSSTILQFIQGLRGDLYVTFEEGTWAAWLYDLLRPHVTNIVVCDPRRNALLREGSESDRIDARKLAELLRADLLRSVYHGENGLRTLKELVRAYLTIGKDLTRVMNRVKAIYRSWGIPCAGKSVYTPRHREEWLSKITQVSVRRRAELYYQQLDALVLLRKQARQELLAEGQKHPAWKWLRSIPDPRSVPSGDRDGHYADTPSVPPQATALEIQWVWGSDAHQRRSPVCPGAARAIEEAGNGAGARSQSQSRSQRFVQERGDPGLHPEGSFPGVLRGFASERDQARDGASHSGAEDCRDHVDRLEERSRVRRPLSEATNRRSSSDPGVPSLGNFPRRWRVRFWALGFEGEYQSEC